jgi:hypothetical protein
MHLSGKLKYTNRLLSQDCDAQMPTFKLHQPMQIQDLDAELWNRSDSRDRYLIQIFDQQKNEIFNASGTIIVKYYDDQEYYYINGTNLTNALIRHLNEWVELIINDEPGII